MLGSNYDRDGDGCIDKDEFADALRVRAKDFPKLAAQLAKYGADALFELWDVNSDGACRSALCCAARSRRK